MTFVIIGTKRTTWHYIFIYAIPVAYCVILLRSWRLIESAQCHIRNHVVHYSTREQRVYESTCLTLWFGNQADFTMVSQGGTANGGVEGGSRAVRTSRRWFKTQQREPPRLVPFAAAGPCKRGANAWLLTGREKSLARKVHDEQVEEERKRKERERGEGGEPGKWRREAMQRCKNNYPLWARRCLLKRQKALVGGASRRSGSSVSFHPSLVSPPPAGYLLRGELSLDLFRCLAFLFADPFRSSVHREFSFLGDWFSGWER